MLAFHTAQTLSNKGLWKVRSILSGWQNSGPHKRRIFKENFEGFPWTFLSTGIPPFEWIFVDIFRVNSHEHIYWILIDTFYKARISWPNLTSKTQLSARIHENPLRMSTRFSVHENSPSPVYVNT